MIACCLAVLPLNAPAELPIESIGQVQKLPLPYPAHWFWAHDVAFDHMSDGRMILLNADGDGLAEQYKGMVNASFGPVFTEARTRPEFYVAETYIERLNRGKRSDVITVYDKATLSPQAEIPLPGNKRASMMPSRYALRLIGGEKFLLVYNFSPATSVTVIDVAARKVAGEIELPTCAFIFPTGQNGFSSLCGNGSMISFQLDARGAVARRQVLEPFFDVDQDALFEKPAIIRRVAYFPTFLGNLQEINLQGEQAVVGERWNLVPEAERKENWRPGGLQLAASDAAGRFYLLMHKGGKEGTHKDPGDEVWAYDAVKRARSQRIALKTPGLSVEVTRDAEPRLLVVNVEMNIDVYDALAGKHLRTISQFGQETPLILHAVKLGAAPKASDEE